MENTIIRLSGATACSICSVRHQSSAKWEGHPLFLGFPSQALRLLESYLAGSVYPSRLLMREVIVSRINRRD